jgi:hypothetical protein
MAKVKNEKRKPEKNMSYYEPVTAMDPPKSKNSPPKASEFIGHLNHPQVKSTPENPF